MWTKRSKWVKSLVHRLTDLHVNNLHTDLTVIQCTWQRQDLIRHTAGSRLDQTKWIVFSVSWPHSVEPSWRTPFHQQQDTGRHAGCRSKKCSNMSSLSSTSSVWDWPSTPPKSQSSSLSWMSRGWVCGDVRSVQFECHQRLLLLLMRQLWCWMREAGTFVCRRR